jgi:hypothetical protein
MRGFDIDATRAAQGQDQEAGSSSSTSALKKQDQSEQNPAANMREDLTVVLVDQDDSGRSTPVAQVDVPDEAALLPGWKRARTAVSLPEAYATLKVPSGKHAKSPWRMLLAYGGCGTMISVGYMDPGNWSTGLAGGARYGYALLCVVLLSSLAAMFLQHLALKLGVASGRDLAQACHDAYPRCVGARAWFVWVVVWF